MGSAAASTKALCSSMAAAKEILAQLVEFPAHPGRVAPDLGPRPLEERFVHELQAAERDGCVYRLRRRALPGFEHGENLPQICLQGGGLGRAGSGLAHFRFQACKIGGKFRPLAFQLPSRLAPNLFLP